MKAILQWSVNRIHKLDDLFSKDLAFIWFAPTTKTDIDEKQKDTIEHLLKTLSDKEELSRESLNKLLKTFATDNNIKYSILMKILRNILSGLKVSNICYITYSVISLLPSPETKFQIKVWIKQVNSSFKQQ